MGFKSSRVGRFVVPTFVSLSFLFVCSAQELVAPTSPDHHHQLITHRPRPNREALEIVIGGGGGGGITIGGNPSSATSPEISPNCGCAVPPPPPPPCPPPPPPPCPPPPPPPLAVSPRIAMAAKVIQEFGMKITCDPLKIKTTWKGPNACVYKGFKCANLPSSNETALYAVQFNGYGFAGHNLGIDGFIDRLPDVSIFHANSNNFTGKIPLNLNKLPYLFELDLSNNKYNCEFPMAVLQATNLTFLDLRFNSFSGRVPPELFTLQVIALFINNNNFQMDLPTNLGSSPAAFLTLANNQFTGPIPKSIGQMANYLYEILFLNNQLTGCLPYEIGLLKKARVFDVEGNYLTGPIPHSFACLGNLQYLIMARNKFYGPIPEAVCKLPKLVNMTMHDNYFTQVGPECMKLIWKKVLDVRGNCILGLPDQKSPEECDWFFNQPQYCAEEARLFKYIPCKDSASYLDGNVSMEAQSPQPTLTYGALRP